MLLAILKLLKDNPAYRLILAGGLFSSIGSGLTQVAVFGELAKGEASPLTFASTFVLSILPGLFTSAVGARMCYKYSWVKILFIADLLGAISITIPILGITLHSTLLLQMSEFTSSALAGIIIPSTFLFSKIYFQENELAAVAVINNYIFSANVLIGYGLGALCFGYFGAYTYFSLDILTFIASAVIVLLAKKRDVRLSQVHSVSDQSTPGEKKPWWRRLSIKQKRAWLLLPILTLFGGPAVALLPSIGLGFGKEIQLSGLVFNSVAIFIFSKTLGQMLGPIFVTESIFERLSKNNIALFCFSSGFCILYLFTCQTQHVISALIAVVIAHVFSNIIFIMASYSLTRHFSSEEIGLASARQYQFQILLLTALSMLSGTLAEYFSVKNVLFSMEIIALTLLAILLLLDGNSRKKLGHVSSRLINQR